MMGFTFENSPLYHVDTRLFLQLPEIGFFHSSFLFSILFLLLRFYSGTKDIDSTSQSQEGILGKGDNVAGPNKSGKM